VGIDNAKNAALLAIEILALKDSELRAKLADYRKRMRGA
jgi:5-(carboxyamino)imidazole ribonucleotide mutase